MMTRRQHPGWPKVAVVVWLGWIVLAAAGARLEAQEEPPPHAPPHAPPHGPPRLNQPPAESQVDFQTVEAWNRASSREKRFRARLYLLRSHRPPRGPRSGMTARFAIFEEALRETSPSERQQLRQEPIPERVRRLVELTDRFARRVVSRRILQEIPAKAATMQKRGLVTAEEVERVVSIQDHKKKIAAYFALHELAFLRQMRKDGRIDDANYQRIAGLKDHEQRHREVSKVRQAAFRQINAHLIHFLLSPEEKAGLDRAFQAGSHGIFRLRWMERKKRIRLLPLTPSSDPNRLSHLLRMTPEQEARLNDPQILPEERVAAADAIYRAQRKAFTEALRKRAGEWRARKVDKTTTPRAFYLQALRVLRSLDKDGDRSRHRDGNVKKRHPRHTKPGESSRPDRKRGRKNGDRETGRNSKSDQAEPGGQDPREM